LTRIQSGFGRTGESGLCAFSGWRGRGLFARSRTTAMASTYGCGGAAARSRARFSDRPPDQKKYDGADRCGKQIAPEIRHNFESKLFKKEATDDGAHEPYREVVQ